MQEDAEKNKLAGLVRATEKSLFRVNADLKSFEKTLGEIGLAFGNIALLDSASRDKVLSKELPKHLKERKILGQSHDIFNRLESVRKALDGLVEAEEKARFFVERHRTARLYEFQDVDSAIKFARQALEVLSSDCFLFRPRFIGTVSLDDLSRDFNLKKSDGGLLLSGPDLKPFVRAMSEKKFASNISLEAKGLRLVWQDKRTIAVEASSESLYRLDRVCDVLHGKCLEK